MERRVSAIEELAGSPGQQNRPFKMSSHRSEKLHQYVNFVGRMGGGSPKTWAELPSVASIGTRDGTSLNEMMETPIKKRLLSKPFFPVIGWTVTAPDGQVHHLSKTQHAKNVAWDVFENPDGSVVSHSINTYIMILICTSAIVAVVETLPSLRDLNGWVQAEWFFVLNFTMEFVGRLLSNPSQKSFWRNGMNYVDLAAILPFWLDVALAQSEVNLNSLRVLRLGRALRLVKLSRYSAGMRLVINALAASWDAMQLFMMILLLVLVVFSSAIYYQERGTWNPATERYYRTSQMPHYDTPPEGDDPSPFQSIPNSFWWCMVTLTTVGYGDVVPVTYLGQMIAVVTMLVGLIMLALPLSIIGTNFIEARAAQFQEEHDSKQVLSNQWTNMSPEPSIVTVPVMKTLERCIVEAEATVTKQVEMQHQIDRALAILSKAYSFKDLASESKLSAKSSGTLSAKILKANVLTSNGVCEFLKEYNAPEGTAASTSPGANKSKKTKPFIQQKDLVELEQKFEKVLQLSCKTVDTWEGDCT